MRDAADDRESSWTRSCARRCLVLVLPLVACAGSIEGAGTAPSSGSDPPASAEVPVPATAPPATPAPPAIAPPEACKTALAPGTLRRLTRREYDNTVADLLGDTSAPARAFTPEGGSTGFDTASDGATLTEAVVEQYAEAARTVARTAARNLPALLGCDVAARGEDPCAKAFVARFGRRAFRRALSAEELARYESFYTSAKAAHGFAPAVELTVRAFLVAPQFLYKIETGAGPGPKPGQVRLTPHEVASRLSFLAWGSTPDETLLAAADAGKLSTPEAIGGELRRLLAHPRGGAVLRDFHTQWLRLDGLGGIDRGPRYGASLGAAMRAEAETTFDRLVRERGASWPQLMTTPVSFVNAELAAIYGLPGVTGTELREVMRPRDRHRGFLTQPAFLTMHALPAEGSPIIRGKFVREDLLCEPHLPPPPDVDPMVPAATASKTARQQLEERTQSVEPCRTCHARLNPPGFAFGRFDQTGRWHDTDERNRPIDTTGSLTGTDVDGAFAGHAELIDRLARSTTVASCVVTQWFRYVAARPETEGDACLRAELLAAFQASNGDVRVLLERLVTSDLFLYK